MCVVINIYVHVHIDKHMLHTVHSSLGGRRDSLVMTRGVTSHSAASCTHISFHWAVVSVRHSTTQHPVVVALRISTDPKLVPFSQWSITVGICTGTKFSFSGSDLMLVRVNVKL